MLEHLDAPLIWKHRPPTCNISRIYYTCEYSPLGEVEMPQVRPMLLPGMMHGAIGIRAYTAYFQPGLCDRALIGLIVHILHGRTCLSPCGGEVFCAGAPVLRTISHAGTIALTPCTVTGQFFFSLSPSRFDLLWFIRLQSFASSCNESSTPATFPSRELLWLLSDVA